MIAFLVTPRDVVVTVGLVLVIAVLLIYTAYNWIKQAMCKHRDIYETRACQAICRDCSKDLGFIGTWREAKKGKK